MSASLNTAKFSAVLNTPDLQSAARFTHFFLLSRRNDALSHVACLLLRRPPLTSKKRMKGGGEGRAKSNHLEAVGRKKSNTFRSLLFCPVVVVVVSRSRSRQLKEKGAPLRLLLLEILFPSEGPNGAPRRGAPIGRKQREEREREREIRNFNFLTFFLSSSLPSPYVIVVIVR